MFSVINPFPSLYSLHVSTSAKQHSLSHAHAFSSQDVPLHGPSTRTRRPCVLTEHSVARYVRARLLCASTSPFDLSFGVISEHASERLESPVRCCVRTYLLARVCCCMCCSYVIGREFVGTGESPLIRGALRIYSLVAQ